MNDEIKFTPEEARKSAKDLEKIGTDIDAIVANLQSIEESLDEEWQGEAAKSFKENMPDYKEKIQNLRNAMTESAQKLNGNADEYENADSSSAKHWWR